MRTARRPVRSIAAVGAAVLVAWQAVAGAPVAAAAGTTGLTALDTAYTESFDSLVLTGTGTEATDTPAGWSFVENTGNTTYTAGTGSSNAGDTYSFGASGSTDRALGQVRSGTTNTVIGGRFTNNTGGTITSLDLAYAGEQWRLGAIGRTTADRLNAQYSLDSTDLSVTSTGTWIDIDELDFSPPATTGTPGPLDGNAAANRTFLAHTLTGLSIAPGATITLRWLDVDASSSDDGLAIDDVSITPHGIPAGTPTDPSGAGAANPTSVTPGGSTLVTVTVTPGTNPASTEVTVTADLTSIGGSATTALLDDGTAPDATAGDGVYSATATVDVATAAGPKSLPFTVTDAENRSGAGTIGLTVTPLDPCEAADVTIGSVQGSGPAVTTTSTVTVQGVVVGDYEGASPNLRGFYVQDAGDGDAATSDAIFVFEGDNGNRVSVGDVVQVTGAASENQGQSQLSATSGVVSCGQTSTVTPTPVTLPWASADAPEAFEGMLVVLDQTAYVTEHFQLGRFGQVVISSGDRLRQPTNVVAPGAAALALQAQNNLNRLIVDDATQVQNPDPIVFGRGGLPLSASNTLRGGDTIQGLRGVLTYTWAGNSASPNNYRLRPLGSLGGASPDFQPANPRPTSLPSVGGRLVAAGMNQLNYFNTFGLGACTFGVGGAPADCRGADSAAEFDRQWPKTVAAVLKMNPAILGVNEVENDGYGPTSALAHLVDQLNAATAPGTYAYIDVDTATGSVNALGTDAIKVGMVYQPGKVTPVGTTAALNTVAFVNGGDGAARNRASLAQAFEEVGTGARVIVNVNHFKSKGSACDAPDAGDGQGNCNVVRTNAAQRLVEWLATDPTGTGDPDVLLLGDYNSYAMEDPIALLEGSGFTHLIKTRLGPAAYSYVFDGQWGYLDHALASASLDGQVSGVGDYHINSDEPSVLDYNTNFKTAGQVTSLYAPDEFRVSDHDPVVVGLELNAPVPPPVANDVSVTTAEDTPSAVTLSGSGGGGPLTYAVVDGPDHGTLSGTAPDLTYTPAADYSGTDSFTYTVSDGVTTSAPATVSITVTPVDDAPVLAIDYGQCVGSTSASIPLTLTDVDGGPYAALTATSANQQVVPDRYLSVTGTSSGRTLVVKTVRANPGTAVITLTATSGAASSTLLITVRQGGSGNDTITGGDGTDVLFGQGGRDTLNGGAGNDIICGAAGNDIVNGGDGNDVVSGDGGKDTVSGGTGADLLIGGDADDTLNGGVGTDFLYGQAGNDALLGGADADVFDGGTGTDTAADYSAIEDLGITAVP